MQEPYGTDFKLALTWAKENIMPLGTEKTALLGAAGGGGANYFGDGSDGAVTTSGDLTYTPANTSGSWLGDMVVKNYTTLTVSVGDTVTTSQGCSGMLIYCTGNCTINGTISMSQKGTTVSSGWAADNPINGDDAIWMPMFTASPGSQALTVAAADFSGCGSAATTAVANQPGIAGDGTLFTISGGTGGNRGGGSNGSFAGSAGGGGVLASGTYEMWIQNGGGGGGGAQHSSIGSANGGYGGAGTPLSGGSGGGGAAAYHGGASGGTATKAGTGGTGGAHGGHNNGAGGGGGQPGGGGASAGNGSGNAGESGNGGIMWIIVGGDLTFGASSTIQSVGNAGGSGGGYHSGGGGGTGAGAAQIMYKGTLTNSGATFTFTGGAGGSASGSGGAGGIGGYILTQVS